MNIKQIEYSRKVGMPNFSSLSFGATAEVVTGDDPIQVADVLKQFVEENCTPDQSWINHDSKDRKEQKVEAQLRIDKVYGKGGEKK